MNAGEGAQFNSVEGSPQGLTRLHPGAGEFRIPDSKRTMTRNRMSNPPSPGLLSNLKLPGRFPNWGQLSPVAVASFRRTMAAIEDAGAAMQAVGEDDEMDLME